MNMGYGGGIQWHDARRLANLERGWRKQVDRQIGVRCKGRTGISLTRTNVGGRDAQQAGTKAFRALDDSAERAFGSAGSRKAMAITGIMDNHHCLGLKIGGLVPSQFFPEMFCAN